MLSKRRRNLLFLEAAVLTLSVYLFALVFNSYLDDARLNTLDGSLQFSEISRKSSETFAVFSQFESEEICEPLKNQIFQEQKALKELATDLSNFGFLFSDINLDLSKLRQREYYLQQFELYFRVEEYNSRCEDKIVVGWYFFDAENPSFDKQATNIESVVLNSRNGSIFFSFDTEFEEEPLIETLKEKYEVTFQPFVVIGNVTHHKYGQGLLSVDILTVEYRKQKGEAQ